MTAVSTIKLIRKDNDSLSGPIRKQKFRTPHRLLPFSKIRDFDSALNTPGPTQPLNNAHLEQENNHLRRYNEKITKKYEDAVKSIKIMRSQQLELHDNFKLLREKYDDVKSEMQHILWEFIPSLNKETISHFPELGQVNHSVFETPSQIGNYQIGSLLGEGQFADVKSCTHMPTQKKYAMKIMPKQQITTIACLKRAQIEIHLLKCVVHPNIITFVDFINSPKCLYLITEVGGKDLFELFDANPHGVDSEMAKQIVLGIVKPLVHLHNAGICHRDLKPENILLSESKDGLPLSEKNVQLCDFGQSAIVSSLEEKNLSDLCGSPGFFAPEMILGEDNRYNGFTADVWSVGCILLELTRGHDDFCKLWMVSYDYSVLQDNRSFENSIHKAVSQIGESSKPHDIRSNLCLDFLSRLLTIDPESRIRSGQLLNHPWLSDPIEPSAIREPNFEKLSLNAHDTLLFKKEIKTMTKDSAYKEQEKDAA
jgi:serine/threonine protein kinase